MKIYLLLVLISLSISTTAQSLVDTTKLWNVAYCYSGPFGDDCETRSFKFQGDTTIGSYSFKKLYESSDTTLTYWSLLGAMRDSGLKVFYTDFVYDYLLYDFSANVGDTIEPIFFCSNNYLVVDSVDSVLINGQLKRRLIFNFSNCGYSEEWIEDIGSNHGPLNALLLWGDLPSDFGQDLLCYWKNDTVQWINPVYNDCYYVLTDIKEQNKLPSSTIYPNPFSEFAIVEVLDVNSKWNWTLYNGLGLIVQKVDYIDDKKLILRKENLQSGLYIYQIRTEKEFITTGRLVIQ